MICPDYSYSLSSRFYLQSIAREITKILRFGEDRFLSAYKLQSCDARLRKMDSTRYRIGRENLRIYESLHELSTDLAEYISLLSEACVKENGCFSIALSGGTLISLMRKLSEPPYNRTVDWRKWHVFWTDERVVSKVHVDSNYRLAKEDLFSKVPVVSSHLHSINDTLSAEEAAAEYKFILRQLVKGRIIGVSESNDCPKFDLILLNMGSDGHVASLFPDHAALDEKDEWVTFMIDSPVPPPERITFTMPVINSASNVAMVVTGDDKAESVKLAMNETISISEHSFPARLVRPTEGNLMWFLDRSSASKLDNFLPTD